MNLKRIFSILVFLILFNGVQAQTKTEGLEEINGTQLFIDQEGKGEVLLVIHGGPGLNHSYFKPHLEQLATKFKVIYYDQRACGQSAIPAVDSLSLSFFINDIEAIRKLSGAKKVNLLAHSWGALLAVQYGMKYPEKINKMILSNPVALNLEYQKASMDMLQSKTTKQDSIDRAVIIASNSFKYKNVSSVDSLMQIVFRASFFDRSKSTALKLNLPTNYFKATNSLYQGLGKDLQAYDFYQDVKSFSFPVLIIAGSADNIPIAAIHRIQENIPKSKLVMFDKSGHFPFIEEPSKFNAVVISFLKK